MENLIIQNHAAYLKNGSRGWNLIIGGNKFNPLLGQRWLIIWNIPGKKLVIVAQMRGSAPGLIGCFGEHLGTQLPEKAALPLVAKNYHPWTGFNQEERI